VAAAAEDGARRLDRGRCGASGRADSVAPEARDRSGARGAGGGSAHARARRRRRAGRAQAVIFVDGERARVAAREGRRRCPRPLEDLVRAGPSARGRWQAGGAAGALPSGVDRVRGAKSVARGVTRSRRDVVGVGFAPTVGKSEIVAASRRVARSVGSTLR
jgi:hypothetical protein